MEDGVFVIEAEVRLLEVEPPIWRRLRLPLDLNLAQLHEVIQASFGWTDSHLHQFSIGGLIYGAPEFDEDGFGEGGRIFEATDVTLADFTFYPRPPPPILYEYDFGDGWVHEIALSRTAVSKAESKLTCLDGARRCPPEDVGGPRGYQDFLRAWRDPQDREHRAMRRWAPRGFDPERFDANAATRAMRTALRRCRGGYRFRLL